MTNMKNKYYIKAYGCQMNLYEAGVVSAIMDQAGFKQTESETDADIIYLLTCSVRNHAEQRALGRVNYFRGMKKDKPDLIIGMLGCMAQSYKDKLNSEYGVDIVAGPDQYRILPEMINTFQQTHLPQNATSFSDENYEGIMPRNISKTTGFISIMRGCNNFCSYCIVPYVRGRERSKSLNQIIKEAEILIQNGVQDITLVGQNVLAWRQDNLDFLDLIKAVDKLDGYTRLRFITSHPKDLTQRHIQTFAGLTKFCAHIHLPIQSGSDRILQLMNRGYTCAEYIEKVEIARKTIPELSFTTDILVGFPSETDADFQKTIWVIKQLEFDFAYMFRYSERPYTKSRDLKDKVPEQVSRQRLTDLIQTQNQITARKSHELLGRRLEVLVESKNGTQAYARSRTNKIVIIKELVKTGQTYLCQIDKIIGWTPIGKILETIKQEEVK